jgi:outer membrane protein assembly factor BamB
LVCTNTGDGLYSLDPRTGQENWRAAKAFSMRVVSSPIAAGGLLFGSTGSGGGGNYVTAVRPGKQSQTAYSLKNAAPYVPTLVAQDDLLFLLNDKGVASCVDPRTGDDYWRERIGQAFSGSPIIADGKLYCVGDDGLVTVLAAAKEFRLLGQNPLGEPTRATPAVSGGRLYFRTNSQLFSLSGKKA